MGELGGKDGTVAGSGSHPKGQEEKPVVPVLQGVVAGRAAGLAAGPPGADPQGKTRSTPPLRHASHNAGESFQPCQCVCCTNLVPCPLRVGFQPEAALLRGLPALL